MSETRYRAYCDDCYWNADETWLDEENAYTDLNAHMQQEHYFNNGVLSFNG